MWTNYLCTFFNGDKIKNNTIGTDNDCLVKSKKIKIRITIGVLEI